MKKVRKQHFGSTIKGKITIYASIRNGWCFFMPEEIWFLCQFLRKEVSTVVNRIIGITVKIGKDTTKLQTGFLYNSKCRKNKKLYFINVS